MTRWVAGGSFSTVHAQDDDNDDDDDDNEARTTTTTTDLSDIYSSMVYAPEPATKKAGTSSSGGFWCEVCGVTVETQGRGEHEVSILHLFNAKKDKPPLMRRVQLSEQNVGFRMLAAMGFDELQGGLGEQRQGRLDPVPTSLKIDTRGLGFRRRHGKKKASSSSSSVDGGSRL